MWAHQQTVSVFIFYPSNGCKWKHISLFNVTVPICTSYIQNQPFPRCVREEDDGEQVEITTWKFWISRPKHVFFFTKTSTILPLTTLK